MHTEVSYWETSLMKDSRFKIELHMGSLYENGRFINSLWRCGLE